MSWLLCTGVAQGQSAFCALRSGFYAGAAGFVSAGTSVFTTMLVSAGFSAVEQSA